MRERFRIMMAFLGMLLVQQGIWGQTTSYSILIKQSDTCIPVTSDNATDVLGDGTVSYSYDGTTQKGVLTLNGATINGCIYSENDLIINVIGDNFIIATDSFCIKNPKPEQDVLNNQSSLLVPAGQVVITIADANSSLLMMPKVSYNCIGFFANASDPILSQTNNLLPKTVLYATQVLGGGNGSQDSPYLIKTARDLNNLSKYVNTILLDTNGKTVKLENDIDCSSLTDYEPIGYRKYAQGLNDDPAFMGTFDGNNKTISNLEYNSNVLLYINGNPDGIGLFSYLSGTLKNLTLDRCKLGGGYNDGGITDFLSQGGLIDHCTISNSTISNNYGKIGGFVGYSEGKVQYCTLSNCTITGGGVMGGIVGSLMSNDVNYCTVDGSSISNSAEAIIGGIAGDNSDGSISNCMVKTTNLSCGAGANPQVGAITSTLSPNVYLTGNYYYGDVTVQIGNIVKSGHTQRGMGAKDGQNPYYNFDVEADDGAKLYTKNLTFQSDNYCTITEVSGAYYKKIAEGNLSVAPGLMTQLLVTPIGNYVPTAVKVAYPTTGVTKQTINPTKAADSYTYSFTMPDDDATFSVTSAINLGSNSLSYELGDKEYSGNAVAINIVTMKNNSAATTGGNVSLVNGVDFNVTGFKDSNNAALGSAPVNAGSYFAVIEGIGSYTGTVNVPFTISKKSLADATFSAISDQTYTGSAITPEPAVSLVLVKGENAKPLTKGTDFDFSYSSNTNVPVTANDVPTVTITGKGNFTGTASTTFKIVKATPTVTAPTAKTGLAYTGSAQALVNAGSVTAGTLQYKLGAGGTYGTTIPSATEVGSYAVYYKVVGDANYNDVAEAGPINVTIGKAAGSISYATSSISKTFGDAPFTNALTKTGDGTVTYSSSNTAVAIVNATTGEVTIVNNGTTTITATIVDGTNYTYATKTATYTLSVGTAAMTVTATGYTGAYDGQAHGITVTAPAGATVKYGETAGTYNLNASPTYTNAGTYTVYYQVTKTGFDTVTGSATVTITKVDPTVKYVNYEFTAKIGEPFDPPYLTLEPSDLAVTYYSADKDVATVDAQTGEVTLVAPGKVNIYATFEGDENYNSASDYYILTVLQRDIDPIDEDNTITMSDNDFLTTNDEGQQEEVRLDNTVIYDILYTLNISGDPSESDGYDETEQCVVLNHPVTDREINRIINGGNEPGSEEYADEYTGLTFKVPAGTGYVIIDSRTDGDYQMMVKIGNLAPIAFNHTGREKDSVLYECNVPTWVYVYNGGKVSNARMEVDHRAKKQKGHVKIYSVTRSSAKSSGIERINIDALESERWYDLQGNRIQRPTRKGLYILQGQKVVVK